MPDKHRHATRRTVIRTAGVAVTAVGATGLAAASHTHPAVETHDPTNVDTNSATLNGDLTSLGEDNSSTDVYFVYWEESGEQHWTDHETLTSPQEFSHSVSNLKSGTKYNVQAVAESGGSENDAGEIVEFWTNEDHEDIVGGEG